MMLRLLMVLLTVGTTMASPQMPYVKRGGAVGPGSRGRAFCNPACPRIYVPVCGSDGKTYPNNCVLEYYSCSFGNVTYAASGVCEQCPTSCTRAKRLVCGSDGKTYRNECRLRKASCAGTGITKIKDGPCSANKGGRDQNPCPLVCPYLYAPVCGTDGISYPNTCTLNAAACKNPSIKLDYAGECEDTAQGQQPCPTSCPFDYAPVCGSDGNTYANLCTFQSIACTDASLYVVANGPCGSPTLPRPPCPSSCPGTYDPVCGTDGSTYGNQCTLDLVTCRNPSVTLLSRGECGAPFNRCPDVCTEEEDPVCGSDGVTYRNECVFRATTCRDTTGSATSTVGECAIPPQQPCPVLCPARYKPVCGTDGQTYPNQCVLESEACYTPSLAVASKGECSSTSNSNPNQPPSKTPTRSFTPRPPPTTTTTTTTTTTPRPIPTFTLFPPRLFCPNTCGRNFSPVCGSDGKTYYNRCVVALTACRERRPLSVLYLGMCV